MNIKRYEIISHVSIQYKLSPINRLLFFGTALTQAIHPCWSMVRRSWPSLVCHHRTCYCTRSVEIFVNCLHSHFRFTIQSNDRLVSKIPQDLVAHIFDPLNGAQLLYYRYYWLKSFLNFLCCLHCWYFFFLHCRIHLSRCSLRFRWLMREKRSRHR